MSAVQRFGNTVGAVGAALLMLLTAACTVTPQTFDPPTGSRSLTVWSYLAGDTERAAFDEIDKLFARTHPDVDVHYVFVPLEEFGPKLLAANGSGDGPDVIIANPVVDFPLLSSAGVYADLGQRWANYPDRQQFADLGLWRKDGERDGSLYGIHWRYNDLGLWYNKDILDRHDIEVPRTTRELTEAMRTIKSRSDIQPMVLPGVPGVQTAWATMVWLLGDGVTYCDLDSPVARQTLSMLDNWQREGYLPGDTAALATEDAYQRFLTGDVAFAIGGNWRVGYVEANEPGFRIGSAQIPAGRVGSKMFFAGESVGIGRHAKEPDLAWEYLKASYLSAEAQRTMFGVTGALPTRNDVLYSDGVAGKELTAPFVDALGPDSLEEWPDNPNTLDAQNEVGAVFSSMIAGEIGPREATGQIRERVADYFADGGGGC